MGILRLFTSLKVENGVQLESLFVYLLTIKYRRQLLPTHVLFCYANSRTANKRWTFHPANISHSFHSIIYINNNSSKVQNWNDTPTFTPCIPRDRVAPHQRTKPSRGVSLKLSLTPPLPSPRCNHPINIDGGVFVFHCAS